jgi:hypothetical protein
MRVFSVFHCSCFLSAWTGLNKYLGKVGLRPPRKDIVRTKTELTWTEASMLPTRSDW